MKRNLFLLFFILMNCLIQAQNDTIQIKDGPLMVGEIQSFSKGVLTLKTSYSDKDFKIEFDKVTKLIIQKNCLVSLSNGRRRFGHVRTTDKGEVVITQSNGKVEYFQLDEIISLVEINDSFWKRFNGSIDLGFNFSKAQNNIQFNTAGQFNYFSSQWRFNSSVNFMSSAQDSVEKIRRKEANIGLARLLGRKWFLVGNVSYLSNTEQALKGRYSPSLSGGRFLVSNNKIYLGIGLGLVYNIENYDDATLDKTSSEGLIRSNLNMYNFDDFSLTSSLQIFPSLSENGRIRTDFDITFSYDLPLDFYVKLQFTLNYDNQPAVSGNEIDYFFSSGFGWEFNK